MENEKPRTPGPLDPNETGPVADDIVVPSGQMVYVGGTIPRTPPHGGIKFKPPLDKAEIGTAWN